MWKLIENLAQLFRYTAVKDLVIGLREQMVKFILECTGITLKKLSVSNGERHWQVKYFHGSVYLKRMPN